MTIQQLLKTAPVTTLLLVSFIGLFIMQVLTGVDANNPSTEALIKWGANALPFTMDNEPWRLVSSAFLHIGLMHLLFNGFAMYFLGKSPSRCLAQRSFWRYFYWQQSVATYWTITSHGKVLWTGQDKPDYLQAHRAVSWVLAQRYWSPRCSRYQSTVWCWILKAWYLLWAST